METVDHDDTVREVRQNARYSRCDVLKASTGNKYVIRKVLLNTTGQYLMYEVEWLHSNEVVILGSSEVLKHEKVGNVDKPEDAL